MDTLYGTPFAPFGPRWSAGRTGGRRPNERPANPNMRISDADRSAVADELSKHYGDGRLDEAEFNERLTKVMSAKTEGDLVGLMDDLPRVVPPPPPPEPVPFRRRASTVLGLMLVAFLLLSVASAVWSWHLPLFLIFVVGLFVWRRHHRHLHRWHGGHGPVPLSSGRGRL